MLKGERNKQAALRQQVLALLDDLTPAAHRGLGVTTNARLLLALTAATQRFANATCEPHIAIAARKTAANQAAARKRA